MASLKECEKLLGRYMTARIPFISINTLERSRVLKVLGEIAEDQNLPVCVHTLSKGLYDLASGKSLNNDKSVFGAIDFATEQMSHRQNVTVVLTEPPDITSENNDSRYIFDLVNLANETGGVIIVFTNGEVWNRLQRTGMTLSVDLPDEDEMYTVIKHYVDSYRNEIDIEWTDADVREASSILQGVTTIEAENVMASLVSKRSIKKSDLDELRASKDSLFTDISGLEKIKVDASINTVAGLAGLQNWLKEKQQLMTVEKKALLKSMGLTPPRGILLVGVPGCGKSLSAKSIAYNWKLPLYRLDFATVQGSYVGQSEQQLKEALRMAEHLSPCVLWIDEIEKGLSGAGSSNDGGVSTRMVGQFLFWMQECKQQVFVVATANDVSMLPSELLRRGRFDELFFVDLPNEEERRSILSMYMKKYLKVNFSGPVADKLVGISDGFTGADLESTVRDLAYRTISNPDLILSEEVLITAFNNVVPLSQTSPEKIDSIRQWGKERAVPASGRPIGSSGLPERQSKENRIRRVLI